MQRIKSFLNSWIIAVLVLGTSASFWLREQQRLYVQGLVEQELASQAIGLTDAIVDRLYRMRHGLRALELLAGLQRLDTNFDELLKPFESDIGFSLDMVGAESYGVFKANGPIKLISLTEHSLASQENWLKQPDVQKALTKSRQVSRGDQPVLFTPGQTPASLTILLLPTSASNEASNQGTWIYLAVNLQSALKSWSLFPEQMAFRIRDMSPTHPPHFLLGGVSVENNGVWSWQSTRQVWGSQWRFEAQALAPQRAPPGVMSPSQVFWSGMVTTCAIALACVTWLHLRRQRGQVERRQIEFANLVDNASDAFVIHDQQGRIQRINQAAQDLLGWTPDEMAQFSWADIQSEQAPLQDEPDWQLQPDAKKQGNEISLKTKFGEWLPVSVSSFLVSDRHDESLVCRIIRDHRPVHLKRLDLQEQAAHLSEQVVQRTEESRLATQRLQGVLDSLPAAIAYWNLEQANEFANRSYWDWFSNADGIPNHDSLLSTWQNETQSADLFESWTRARQGIGQVVELLHRSTSGSLHRHLECHWIADTKEGQVLGVYELIIDISQLKNSQRQLVETSLLQDALMQALQLHTIYSVTDAQGTILEVNEAFCRISGYTREELLGRNHRIVNSGAHSDDFWRNMWQSVLSGHRWHGEVCNRNKSGDLYWVDSIVAPFRGETGEIERLISLRTDITALKMAEQRLRIASEGFSERAGQIAGVGGWEIDLATGEMTLTRHARHIYGVEDDQAMNLDSSLASFPPDAREELRQAIFTAIQKGKGWDLELPLIQHHGRQIWVRSIGELEYSEDGLVAQRLVGAMQDVTAKHLANQALKDASTLAQQASQAKTDFLANMSHEIRTPLNAMIGMTHVLAQSIEEPDQRSWVSKIQTSGMTLLSLINDILDLSKIEAGELSLAQEPFHLRHLMAEVAEVLSSQALSQGLLFDTKVEQDVPDQLIGDGGRIRQILINLVGNAIKFTRRGAVRVNARLLSSQREQVRIVMSVQDTGIGISQEVLSKLFTPFSQADASTTREFGGTGLGLSIVRRLVNLMGGEIEVQSTPGEGSTFEVQLPLHKSEANQTKPIKQTGFIVRCSPKLLPHVSDALRELGWLVQQTTPSPDQETNHFLLLDASEEIDDLDREVPYLVCPLSPAEPLSLFNAVSQVLHQFGQDDQALFSLTKIDKLDALSLTGVQILAVDDSDINREVLVRLLGSEGAHVQEAYDGERALQMLHAAPDQFDVVLMDIQMPVLDGVQATQRIRQHEIWQQLPIIALTAGVLSSEKERAWEAGMNDFIGKPIDPTALIGVIRHWIQRYRNETLPLQPRASYPSGIDTDWPALPGIEQASAKRIFLNDAQAHRALLNRLIDTYRPIFQAAEHGEGPLHNTEACLATLHKFAGAAATLGASDLASLARRAHRRQEADPAANLAVEFMAISEILNELTEALHHSLSKRRTPNHFENVDWNADQVEMLRQALRDQKFNALKLFEALRRMLELRIGAAGCSAIGEHLIQLNFPEALRLLEARLQESDATDT